MKNLLINPILTAMIASCSRALRILGVVSVPRPLTVSPRILAAPSLRGVTLRYRTVGLPSVDIDASKPTEDTPQSRDMAAKPAVNYAALPKVKFKKICKYLYDQ